MTLCRAFVDEPTTPARRGQAARDELASRFLGIQQQALQLEDTVAQLEAQLAAASDRGEAAGEPAGPRDQPDATALQTKVAALKAGRDRLIAALDAQTAELEGLQTTNAALNQVRGRCRCIAADFSPNTPLPVRGRRAVPARAPDSRAAEGMAAAGSSATDRTLHPSIHAAGPPLHRRRWSMPGLRRRSGSGRRCRACGT